MTMTGKTRDWEVDAASKQIEILNLRKTTLENKLEHYSGLTPDGLSDWERTQQIAKHAGSIIRGGEATFGFLAAACHFLPQIGSPFAMKYGGIEVGKPT